MKDCVYPPLFSFHGSHTSIEVVAMGMKFDVGHHLKAHLPQSLLGVSLSISIYI